VSVPHVRSTPRLIARLMEAEALAQNGRAEGREGPRPTAREEAKAGGRGVRDVRTGRGCTESAARARIAGRYDEAFYKPQSLDVREWLTVSSLLFSAIIAVPCYAVAQSPAVEFVELAKQYQAAFNARDAAKSGRFIC
jgi:hypothetical protein